MEIVKLGTLLDKKIVRIVTPSVKLKTENIFQCGYNPVISQDASFLVGYTNIIDNKLLNPPYLIFGDHTEIFKWVKTNFVQGADGIKILTSDNKNLLHFVYYALLACYRPSGLYERHYSKLLKTRIPFFNDETQKIIVSILSNYDNLIENNKKRIEILEEKAHELFKERFVKFRFPNWQKTNFMNGIPKDWGFRKIDGLVVQKKKKLKTRNDLKILDLANMPSFSWDICNYSNGSDFKSNIYELDTFDLVFGSIRPYLGKGGFAPNSGGICGTVFNFVPTKKEFYSYLLCLVTSKNFFEYANTVTKGTKMPIISFSDIQNYKTFIPNDTVVFKQFNDLVFPMIEEIRNLINQNKNLATQRDLLLPRLMSGKLEVK